MDEEWRSVVGYEGAYEVSNLGRVRSVDRFSEASCRWGGTAMRRVTGRVLKPYGNGRGYLLVSLCLWPGQRDTHLVHRAVGLAFLEPVPGKEFINHRDGDKSNNAAPNLEWCTRSENMLHAHATGLAETPKMAVVGTCVRTGTERYFESQIQAEIQLSGKQSSAVHHCLVGKKKSAYGHVWRIA